MDLCAARKVLIVEDAAYADIYFGDVPPPSLYGMAGGEGILRVGTFSKPIATGLRVGWVQAREDFINALSRVKFDMGSSPLLLRALADYVGSGSMDVHLDEMRKLYKAKCDALSRSLEEHCPGDLQFTKPEGGFFLWVKSLEADAQQLAKRAAEEGLVFPAGSLFFLNGRATTRPTSGWRSARQASRRCRWWARGCGGPWRGLMTAPVDGTPKIGGTLIETRLAVRCRRLGSAAFARRS